MNSRQTLKSAIAGVLYAEDFDELVNEPTFGRASATPPPSSATPPLREPPAPTFSLAELRAAADRAFEEGREAERSAMIQRETETRAAALASVAEQLRLAHQQTAHVVEDNLGAIAATTASLLASALPALCASRAEQDVRAVLKRILIPARQAPQLQIRLHPSLRQVVENDVALLTEDFGTQIAWTESERLPPGDIIVSWQGGSARRDTAATCATIKDAVLAMAEAADGSRISEER